MLIVLLLVGMIYFRVKYVFALLTFSWNWN